MNIHSKKPIRSTIVTRAVYQDYRPELQADFNGCCGYCDDSDERADPICFHIDHFAPKKRFPALATTYTNLVYSCRFCNMHKSNKWEGDDPALSHDGTRGFIDPCSPDFDDHLERDDDGRILGTSDLGRHIVKELNLSLLRHQLLWRAREARALQAQILPLIARCKESGLAKSADYIALLERSNALWVEIDQYEHQAAHG